MYIFRIRRITLEYQISSYKLARFVYEKVLFDRMLYTIKFIHACIHIKSERCVCVCLYSLMKTWLLYGRVKGSCCQLLKSQDI